MLRIKSAFLAVGITIALSQVALAADLPRKAYAPLPPPPPPYVWTGCYLGANVGGAWSHIEVTDVSSGATASRSNSGVAGGGQIGCDYQMGAWVVGIRNMLDATGLNGSRTFSDGLLSGTINSHVHWFDTLSARGGYLVQPNVLFYAQGGAAWSRASIDFVNTAGSQVGEISKSKTGWTVGGGVEWMFIPHWSLFLEYNFMGFGTNSNAFQACSVINAALICSNGTFTGKANLQDVLVGVNYKF
jgi:outer membrane immunogenic protein